MKILIGFIAGVVFTYQIPQRVLEAKPFIVEYHHTVEVCQADDIGMIRLTLEDVRDLL